MTPEQVSVVATLINILDKVSGWPFGLILFSVIVGPWLMAVLLAWQQSRRFEAVVKMYEDNVVLVEKHEEVCSDLKSVIMLNTQVLTTVEKDIKSNQFCPMVRLEKKAAGLPE